MKKKNPYIELLIMLSISLSIAGVLSLTAYGLAKSRNTVYGSYIDPEETFENEEEDENENEEEIENVAEKPIEASENDMEVEAEESTPSDIQWSLEDGVLTISGTGEMEDYDYEYDHDPESEWHDEYWYGVENISSCTAPWFERREEIKSLVIEEGVTRIGTGAFAGLTNLTGELLLPDSLTSMGDGAFYGCSGLTGVLRIPSGIKEIRYDVFRGCNGLSGSIQFPPVLETIDGTAFACCSGLTGTLEIPDSVSSLKRGAFVNCTGLEEVIIPSNVNGDEDVFKDCTSIQKITIEDGANNLRFEGLTGLKELNAPANIKYLSFSSCGEIDTINYDGPQQQWESRFGFAFSDTKVKTVNCIDGVITDFPPEYEDNGMFETNGTSG